VATIAGVLLSPVSLVDPSIGFLGIKAFAATVVGGFGSLIGTVFGGLIVGVFGDADHKLDLAPMNSLLINLTSKRMRVHLGARMA
jgi:branched-subunit amino acid ABC-type transport system permease component